MPGYCRKWLDQVPDLIRLSGAYPQRFPYFLESVARGKLGGTSLLLFSSGELLVSHADGKLDGPGDGNTFFDRFESWYQQEKLEITAKGFPDDGQQLFPGGWFVFLGYEMATEVEPTLTLPVNTSGLPDAIAHRCPGAVIVVHGPATERAVAVAESPEIMDEMLACLRSDSASRHTRPGPAVPDLLELVEENPERFKSSVRRIRDYLAQGDVFQVNVSRPWTGVFQSTPDPCVLYQALRQTNPAPFAGMMRWGDSVLLSSSPERLVQTRGRSVQTRPIAGTRPRGSNEFLDRELSDELISNIKERAEHVMLIDLERNDLGRVCEPGTIEVNELMVVESYTHVHHIVSNVRGELRRDASPVDAIRAVFPGGTITGCPKVRCMEIIAELEGAGRGFYTGSMGYLGLDGSMDLNILIRSMLVRKRQFSFRTGAGIVADSVPEQELVETADKARGMLLAVESHGKERKHA